MPGGGIKGVKQALLRKYWENSHTPLTHLNYISVSSGDDFFGEDFNDEFDEMEKSDKFHNKLEDGFKNWEER